MSHRVYVHVAIAIIIYPYKDGQVRVVSRVRTIYLFGDWIRSPPELNKLQASPLYYGRVVMAALPVKRANRLSCFSKLPRCKDTCTCIYTCNSWSEAYMYSYRGLNCSGISLSRRDQVVKGIS